MMPGSMPFEHTFARSDPHGMLIELNQSVGNITLISSNVNNFRSTLSTTASQSWNNTVVECSLNESGQKRITLMIKGK